MAQQHAESQHETAEVAVSSVQQKLATHLTQAIEADNTAIKNYHIRTAHQFLLVMEELSVHDTE
jgi:hypothetical protein